MKSLEQLNNVERAKLFFELFPENIPGIICCIKSIAGTICNDPADMKQKWKHQIFTAGFWIGLTADIRKRIDKYLQRLAKSSRLFSDQLFDGYNALFSVHCLQQYIKAEENSGKPVIKAIEMFFGVDIRKTPTDH